MRRPARVDPIERLGDYSRVQVRAGILSAEQLRADLLLVAAEDVGGDDPAGAAHFGERRIEVTAASWQRRR